MRMDKIYGMDKIYDGKPPNAEPLKTAASGWCTNGLVAKGVQSTIVRGRWGNLKIMCEIGSSRGVGLLCHHHHYLMINIRWLIMTIVKISTMRMMGNYNGT